MLTRRLIGAIGLALALFAPVALASATPAHALLLVRGDGSDGGTGGGSGGGSGGSGGSGGGSDGSGGGSGGGGGLPATGVSVPRVMLTDFVATPGQVTAGDAVEVTFTLHNTSRTTRVNNLKVTLTPSDAGSFLPINGSSSMFISTIKADGTITRTMAFRTLPTLEARPYGMSLKVEYEDALANPYSSEEQVAIPVVQTQRADTSSIQAMPESISVGQQSSVTFSINNLGKTKLFNARVAIPEGQGVSPQEVFVGNIEPGASGNVDMTLMAEGETTEAIRAVITFEDATGDKSTLEKPIKLSVIPQVTPEEPFPPVEPENPEGTGFPLLPILWGVGALVVLGAIIALLVRQRRRHKASQLKESDMALLDGDPLVPTDRG